LQTNHARSDLGTTHVHQEIQRKQALTHTHTHIHSHTNNVFPINITHLNKTFP